MTRTEAPRREVVTTERVEVREQAVHEEMPIKAEEVEEGRARTAVPGTETVPGETVVEEVRREPPAEMETWPATGAERHTATTGPAPGHLSAADLQAYLKGVDYPAGRQDLMTHARQNNAPEDVIAALDRFSDRTYQSATDVGTEFAKIK